jgi:hypothetical protein
MEHAHNEEKAHIEAEHHINAQLLLFFDDIPLFISSETEKLAFSQQHHLNTTKWLSNVSTVRA